MYKKLVFLTMIFLFFIFTTLNTPSMATDAKPAKNVISDTFWTLTQWNENATVNWWTAGQKVNASVNSSVSYKITAENPSNFSYPNSGQFSIGNVSALATDNNDISSNLALSIWPWMPGVIAHTNWTYQKITAEKAANGTFTQGQLDIFENHLYDAGEYPRRSIQFYYSQNQTLGNQNTTLIYDYDTGVLLCGYSEFTFATPYYIELRFHNSTLITESNILTSVETGLIIPYDSVIPLLTFSTLIVYSIHKKR